MEFPRTIHASVLLLDEKIINWKIGTTSWKGNRFLGSSQPINLVKRGCDNEWNPKDNLRSEAFTRVVNSEAENNMFFERAEEFLRMYEIHEDYPVYMTRPYK